MPEAVPEAVPAVSNLATASTDTAAAKPSAELPPSSDSEEDHWPNGAGGGYGSGEGEYQGKVAAWACAGYRALAVHVELQLAMGRLDMMLEALEAMNVRPFGGLAA